MCHNTCEDRPTVYTKMSLVTLFALNGRAISGETVAKIEDEKTANAFGGTNEGSL